MAGRLNGLPIAPKVIAIATVIVAFLLFLFATVALDITLPFWLYALVTLVLLVVVLLIIFGTSTQPPQAPPAGPTYRSRILGAGGSLLAVVVLVAIVAGIIMAILSFYTPSQKYVFDSADSLKDWDCSGYCAIVSGTDSSYLSLAGTMTLKNSSGIRVKSVLVTPTVAMPGEVWIGAGTVSAKYYTEKRERQGLFGTEYQYIPHGELYRDNATDYTASTNFDLSIGSPLPIELKASRLKEFLNGKIDLVSRLWNSPELAVGGNVIAWGPSLPMPPILGPISIRGQGINIEKVEIY